MADRTATTTFCQKVVLKNEFASEVEAGDTGIWAEACDEKTRTIDREKIIRAYLQTQKGL